MNMLKIEVSIVLISLLSFSSIPAIQSNLPSGTSITRASQRIETKMLSAIAINEYGLLVNTGRASQLSYLIQW